MSGVTPNSPIEGPLPDSPSQHRGAFIAHLEQAWEGDPDAEMRIQQGIAQFDVATDPNATPDDWRIAGLPGETNSEDSEPTSLSRGNRLILGGMLVTMAATGVIHATGKQPTDPEASVPISSVQLARQSQSVYNAVTEATEGSVEGNALSKSSVWMASGGKPELKQKIQHAVDLARVERAVSLSYSWPELAETITSAIEDPTKRVVAETAVYTFTAEEVLLKAAEPRKGYPLPLSEAKRQLNEQMPTGAESIREHAIDALERRVARDAIDEFTTSPMDTTDRLKVWATAEELSSHEKKVQLQRMSDSLTVADALQDLYNGTKTSKDLEALAAELTNDTMRGVLLRYSDGSANAEAHGYGTWLRGQVLEEQGGAFNPDDSPLEIDIQIARYIRAHSSEKAVDARNAAEASLGETFGMQSGLRLAQSAAELSQEVDPYEIVDLSKVVASQKVPNLVSESARRKLGGEHANDEYNQFGEVLVEDGKLVLSFQDGLSDKLRQQFTQAVESNRSLLEAAFSAGNLVSMRFVLADDFFPYYLPTSREVVMVLTPDGYLTVDMLSSVVTHETTHALFRDYFLGIEVSDDEHKTLARACRDLEAATYREMGQHITRSPQLIANLRAATKPEHARLVDFLSDAAKSGDLDRIQQDTSGQDTTHSNQCTYSGNSGEFFSQLVSAAGLGGAEFRGELRYLIHTPAFGEFMKSIEEFVHEGSLYGRVINESGYIMTDYPHRKNLGHGQDNANETYASLMDAALNYPGGLQVKLAGLSPRAREAVKHMLDTEWDAAAARYPSLQPLFDRARTILAIKK